MAIVLGHIFAETHPSAQMTSGDPGVLRIPLAYHTDTGPYRYLIVPSSRHMLDGVPNGHNDHHDFYSVATVNADRVPDWMHQDGIQGIYKTQQDRCPNRRNQ